MTTKNDIWLNEEAERSRVRHTQYRAIADAEKRQRRQRMTLEGRWKAFKASAGLHSGARAAVVGRASPSAESGLPLRRDAGFDLGAMDSREVQGLVATVERAIAALHDSASIDLVPKLERNGLWAIERLEAALDGNATDGTVLLHHEKNSLIRQYAKDGMTPAEIHERQPALGSIKVIERVLGGFPV